MSEHSSRAGHFDGQHITGDVNQAYLDRIEQARSDFVKTARSSSNGNDHVNAEVVTFPR